MTVSIWITIMIAVLSLTAGLWIGRSIRWMAEETEERVKAGEENTPNAELIPKGGKRISLGWSLASPVSGAVSTFYEGNRCGVLIQPEQGEIYAPMSGRILKLYPMGRAMLLGTDDGTSVLIKVGNSGDDMCSRYYRPRVVQNEIVSKGKLLLEFDREGLESQGVDVTVSVSLESGMEEKNIAVTSKDNIRVGEELMWG